MKRIKDILRDFGVLLVLLIALPILYLAAILDKNEDWDEYDNEPY